MTQLIVKERVGRTCKELFSLLTEEEGWSQFTIGPGKIVSTKGLGSEINVGSEVTVTWSCQGIEHDAIYRIGEFERDKCVGFTQKRGVFKSWMQRVMLEDKEDGGVEIRIEVYYALPFSFFGTLVNDLWVRNRLEKAIRSWVDLLDGNQDEKPSSSTYEVMTP